MDQNRDAQLRALMRLGQLTRTIWHGCASIRLTTAACRSPRARTDGETIRRREN